MWRERERRERDEVRKRNKLGGRDREDRGRERGTKIEERGGKEKEIVEEREEER